MDNGDVPGLGGEAGAGGSAGTELPCTREECGPAIGAPNERCPDGENWSGFGDCQRLDDGTCGYPRLECPDPDACEPGESFLAADGCNTCECPESGSRAEAACTEIGCGPQPDECIPDEEFPAGDGCNSCTCPTSGIRSEASCTETICSDACRSQDDCLETQFCDFPDGLCGARQAGVCTARPEICPAGGIGACGCDGTFRLNECELSGSGSDDFRFGGCSRDDPSVFECGDMSCNIETDLCEITPNDAVGEGEPEYYFACSPLPADCPQGDCSCVPILELATAPTCFDGIGKTILFGFGG